MKFSASISALAGLLMASNVNADQVVSVHGSGTTNPSKCYWNIMDKFEEQSKLPIRMTYRAVGSSTGQAEFIGNITDSAMPDNHFGSGDIPIKTASYNSLIGQNIEIVHLPVLLGAISFFHSVPTGEEKLFLEPCLLAKIFRRKITDWNDPEIRRANPNLNLPNPFPIYIAHRVLGSSSTSSIAKYLNKACEVEWPSTFTSSTLDWVAVTGGTEGTEGCQGSAGMTNCIRATEGTIGYIDSGHGHSENLQEIELLNAAGTYLSSKEAAERGGLLTALTSNPNLPPSLYGNFGEVDLLNEGGTYSWPIVALSYVYVRQDLPSFLPDPVAQGLLKAFLLSLYDEKYIDECEDEFGFVKVTGALRDQAIAAINGLTVSPGSPNFVMEYKDDTQARVGQGDYIISQKRDSYSEIEQDDVRSDVAAMSDRVDNLVTQNAALLATISSLNAKVTALENAEHSHDTSTNGSSTFEDIEALIEQKNTLMSKRMDNLVTQNAALLATISSLNAKVTASENAEHSHDTSTNGDSTLEDIEALIEQKNTFTNDEETQLNAALVLAFVSICFWVLAFIVLIAKFAFNCF